MAHKSFQVKEFELTEEGEFTVAFAEVGTTDREGDYTFPGAIPSKDLVVSAYSHASWPQKGGLLPTGRAHIEEKNGIGIAKGRFFTETTHGRDTYLTVKALGELQEWSYGYDVTKTAPPPVGVKALRGLKSLDIYEISPVLIGAGSIAGGPTQTLDIKSYTPELKAAAANVAKAQWALGNVLELIVSESADLEPDDPDVAEDEQDVATLGQIRDLLTTYITATAKEVGTADDMSDLAAEAASRAAAMTNYGWDSADIIASMKSGSLAGLPFAEMSSRLLRDVDAFNRRTKGLLDLRIKEGRAISAARLAQLAGHSSALGDAKKLIDQMIDEAAPKKKSEGKARQMRMAAQLAMTDLGYPTH